MAEICKNCQHEIAINFCSNCGQKKAKRIDHTYIKDEIQYTVFHMNKGFFYSIKKILRNPGKTAREFIDGNRVNHYKPLLLLFVISGISAFIANTFIHPAEIMDAYFKSQNNSAFNYDGAGVMANMYKYQSLMMLASLPFMAFFTWLTFKKWGYNYYENIVQNAFFMICVQTLSILIIAPLQYLLKDNLALFMLIPTIITFLLMFGVGMWFFVEFYNNQAPGNVILRLVIMGVILFAIYILIIVAVVIEKIITNGLPKPA